MQRTRRRAAAAERAEERGDHQQAQIRGPREHRDLGQVHEMIERGQPLFTIDPDG